MDINKIEVGKRIYIIRKSLGVTMKEFGERIGKPFASDSIVSRWEKGKSLPNNERARRIAELGNISIEELLYGKTMERMPATDKGNDYADSSIYEEEKERLIEEYRSNYPKELSSHAKNSSLQLIEYLHEPTNTPSYEHSVILLNEVLKFSRIHEVENNNDPVLIRFLSELVSVLNGYATKEALTTVHTKEEIKKQLNDYINYIIDNS